MKSKTTIQRQIRRLREFVDQDGDPTEAPP